MTYNDINTLIDVNLASGSNIPAIKHREVEHAILDFANTGGYIGYITGINLPVPSGPVSFSGNITSAVADSTGVLITITNAMPSTNYYVRSFVQSLGIAANDTEVRQVLFKVVNSSQFYYIQSETNSATQNLRIHFEVISLD